LAHCPHCDCAVDQQARFCRQCGVTLTPEEPPLRASTKNDYPSPLLPGIVLEGKYQILEEVERGGMGVVYRAHDLTLDRTVAIKALPPHFNVNIDVVERFKREAQAMASLDHPNVVTVYSIGHQGETHYFAMKFLGGRTVAQELVLMRDRGGPFFAPHTVIDVLRQVAHGLGHAHQRGLIHRDIKPSNIMIGADGHVTIMDFGIVKRQVEDTSLTKAGVVFGTPEYMAPEQAQGGTPPDQTTDLYSLGIVAYEMLVGAPPFRGETALAVVLQHIQMSPAPLSEHGIHDIDHHFEAILFRMFTKVPKDRFVSGDALCAALDELEMAPPMARPRRNSLIPIASTRELSSVESGPSEPIIEINRPAPAKRPGTYDLSTLTRSDSSRTQVSLNEVIGRAGPSPTLLTLLALVTFLAVWFWFAKPDATPVSRQKPRGLPAFVTATDAGPRPNGGRRAPATQAAPPTPRIIQVHLVTRPNGAHIYAAEDLTTPLGSTPDIISRSGKSITRDLVLRKPGFHDKRVTLSFVRSKQYMFDLIPAP
jgi:serine/threonine protein kinase